jgi:hypothetical protein
MNKSLQMSIATLILLLVVGSVFGAGLTDPYEILNRHYEAMGGLEKIKAQKTAYMEADLVLVGTGLEGTLIRWSEAPLRSRQEVDLKILKQTSGDNGEYAWSVDENGKLQIHSDERTLKQRRLQKLFSEYEHLNPESDVITLSYEGIDTAAGSDCYVVKIANNINEDVSSQYYDTSTFKLLKSVAESPGGTSYSWYSDFREIGGVIHAFREESTQYPSGMKQVITYTKAEENVPIDPSLFEPPTEDVQDFRFTNGKSAEDIPFKFIENHIYLPIEVGGKTRLWVLDSGAGKTVIDNAFAEELGLKLEGQVKGQGAGNLVDVSFTTLPAFSLPGLEFDEQTAAAIDIAWLFDRWLGMEVVGILGYDFLSRLVTRIDYANELLSFYHPDSFAYQGDGVVLSSPISQGNMPEMEVAVDGQHTGKWSLDLGAGGMSYHYQYAEAHGLLEVPGVDGLGHGAGGSQPKRRLMTETMELAGYTVRGLEITIPLQKGEGAFGHTELTGNIGNTLLRHFVLHLDYERDHVIVEKGADFDRVFPRDNSGLQLANTEGDSLRVIFVADGTPAAESGFEVDDVLTGVNDIEVENLGGIVAVNKLLRKTPGTTLEIDVLRGSEIKKLSLTLRDLFR